MLCVSCCNLKKLKLVSFQGGDFQFQLCLQFFIVMAEYFSFYDYIKFNHCPVGRNLPNFLSFYFFFCLLQLFLQQIVSIFAYYYILLLQPYRVSSWFISRSGSPGLETMHMYFLFYQRRFQFAAISLSTFRSLFVGFFSLLAIMSLKTFASLMGVKYFLIL